MKYAKKHYDIFAYVIFAIFYFWLAAQIPYTHDDWDWGLPIGIQQLVTANLNGRYVGNFLEVVMTRSEILKTIIIGAGFWLLPFIISEIVFYRAEDNSRNERMIGFVFCNVLLLSMPRSIWQQTYGWIAGYANFGMSSFFLLLIMKKFLHIFDDVFSESRASYPRAIALFLICLLGQLFIENISIYVFLSSLVLNLFYWYKTKRFSCECVSIFIASLIGLVLIFSSSIYNTLWSTGEAVNGYRQLFINEGADIQTVLIKCFHQVIQMPQNIYANNLFICMTIIILMGILLMQQKVTNTALHGVFHVGNVLVAACLWFSYSAGTSVSLIASVLFFITVTAELIFIFKREKALLHKLLFVWISPICVILPLAFTSELGARLFFTSNAILILFALFLLRFCLKSMPKKVWCAAIVCTLACVLLIQCGTVYYAIGSCNNQRKAIIENAIKTEADTIYLPQYPHLEYLWCPNPVEPVRETFFKDFYNISQNVSIVIE